MSKPNGGDGDRARRDPERSAAANPRPQTPARQADDSRPLLARILDTPNLPQVVPRLPPEVLHRVIQGCGLEDCGEILTLATPKQIEGVFDLDLWRADVPGRDERFDADRFGVWLEVLVESGADIAAGIVAKMDVELVTGALAQHLLVFDPAAMSVWVDGEEVTSSRGLDHGLTCEVGGYLLVATRTDSWDAIVAVLSSLDEEHAAYFQRVMSRCRTLSSSKPEIDGLDDLLMDREQVAYDLAADREQRREAQGYITPAQARAFMQMARHPRLGPESTPPDSPVSRAYVRAISQAAEAAATIEVESPIAEAIAHDPPTTDAGERGVAEVVDLLLDAGVLPRPPRALLEGRRDAVPRLARIQRHLQVVLQAEPAIYATRTEEIVFLANTLVAGCSFQARSMTVQEASDAAVAICNLGLENWQPHWLPDGGRSRSTAGQSGTPLPDDFLVGQDLIGAFQVGWVILHENVCLHSARELLAILDELAEQGGETQLALDALRKALARGCQTRMPWHARDAMDVLAILDTPAWAALLCLVDECPVAHAALAPAPGLKQLSVGETSFEFIAENRQIASVHDFMRSLPAILAS